MWLVPRLRLALARRPWLYWLAVAVCTAVVVLQWSSAQSSVQRAREAWGTSRRVVVAEAAAAPGEVVTLAVRSYPVAVVPAEALADTDPAAPARAARPLVAGQVLLPGDLLDATTPPSGWVVMAVDPGHAPALTPGQGVAVFVGPQLVCDGVVTAASSERVEVAVAPDCAAAAADALLTGSVVLARVP